ncbi:MAG: trigger factor [Deltaproteobacteria bacterium RIFCSPLOWO2_12_FULL_43_16]|nr:MAG: trigger factor [Deltaproteobacteria bacterium GWA2_43_19]OGQ09364.1 MAG: trigger factor [Deltaproteobacteria bacterium RIFCSPHIGHO2_02_FULL_43_33]OGQ37872.1 MAG: trigger factor [Deltaproteobacteria bacterium RIFCSPLOWO2_01_FULL_42_9]OGQ44354.1 MAG: trigger factor [Deltaproteobacteria bacterium RIFCSPLOWO2_02_44_9]OGQ58593.1 MAG: trigger factor [Deltaproteobacteria bacterium RIFCSPLOWO2_12_FULL_43_16]HBR16806.1 trigger factor [Deltaproteobacteria bacterium]
MKVSIEDLSPVKKRILIEVPPEDVDQEMEAVYRELGEKVSIDGFRKGKIPKAVLESRYKDYVLGEVVSKVIENSYPKAIMEKSLSPVSRPDIDVKEGIKQGKPFSYSATVEVRPPIKVEGYIGIEFKREAVVVADDEVEKTMVALRENNAYYNEVERPAQEQDMVLVDFEGFIEDKPIKNGKASDFYTIIGSKKLVPDIENALIGMKKGEEKEVKARFPNEYGHKELADKEGLFKLKLKVVKERVLPVLDDEFAKDLKLDNVAQLKDKVREGIKLQKEAAEKEKVKKEILEKLIEKNSFDTPPALVANYLQSMISQTLEKVKKGMVRPEDAADMTYEKLREKYAKVAEIRAKEEMILDAIARQENITVSAEEVDLRIREIAVQRYQNYEGLKKKIIEEGSESIIMAGMLEDKVFDFVIKNRQ